MRSKVLNAPNYNPHSVFFQSFEEISFIICFMLMKLLATESYVLCFLENNSSYYADCFLQSATNLKTLFR